MANNKASCPLMDLPLEVRHAIFDFTAVRDVKPKKLLRYWFEKKEAKELIAQKIADDPSAPAPRAVYHNEYDEESDVSEQEDDTDSASEDEGDEDGEDNENEDEHEDDMLQDQDEDEVDDMEDDDDEVADGVGLIQAQNTTQLTTSGQAQNQSVSTNQQPGEDEMEDDNDEDSDDDAQDDGDATGTVAAPPPPPAPAVHVSHKWRHVPNFMRITHCPPPVELLLASKQLNQEAKDWFYDVAVLRINATGSFAHTSFFEEAFRQITEAAFSPMENVRKVEATFAWDTTWLRADETGYAGAVFPALLRQRSDFVYQILAQAPDLKDVTIYWHDTAQDDESANLMLDTLAPFHSLNAKVTIKEHYIAADTKPYKRSIAGQRRVEFQAIIDAGLDRLF